MSIQLTSEEIEQLTNQILSSSKYLSMGIPKETTLDLIRQEMPGSKDIKQLRKRTRAKLHNICAPYLGDLDYEAASEQLQKVIHAKDRKNIQALCIQFLKQHISTRERLPFIEDFYKKLFQLSGQPGSILDLACGLNPFSIPWMGLTEDTQYYAYDIHHPRIELVNQFLKGIGLKPLGMVQDILVHPPLTPADVAFLFKEAHRIEQRKRGATRWLLEQLQVKWIFISLPRISMNGQRDLSQRMRTLIHSILNHLPWEIGELEFENEIVFCIQR
jgi:16S rRNA (guanine(1405)-N(7))-methyltransferase